MRDTLSPRSPILRKIRRAFFKYRRDHVPGHIDSEALRHLVSEAIEAGHGPSMVASATGLSRQTIVNWHRKQTRAVTRKRPRSLGYGKICPPPVELKVMTSRTEAPVKPEAAQYTVRIVFRGGACMEMPASALSQDLVATLNGVAS